MSSREFQVFQKPKENQTNPYIASDLYHPFPSKSSINVLFEKKVADHPDSIAIKTPNHCSSYLQVNQLANQCAHFFHREYQIFPEDKIIVCLEKSESLITIALSIFKCSAVYTPVESSWPLEMINQIVREVEPKIVITNQQLITKIRAPNKLLGEELIEKAGKYPNNNLQLPQTGSDLSYLMYSSGSTGKPKGVLGEHQNIISRFAWAEFTFPFQKNEVAIFASPIGSIESLWHMFGSLIYKVPLVIPSEEELKNLDALISLLNEEKVTRIELVPSFLRLLLNADSDFPSKVPNLYLWDLSGEVLNPSLARKFFKSKQSHQRLINRYGATEASSLLFHEVAAKDIEKDSIPIGRPTGNTTIFILDSHLKPVKPGETGYLYVTGPRVTRGYFKLDQLTKSRFLQNPFQDSQSYSTILYKTGDQVFQDKNGNVFYKGRSDFQLKINGYKINLNEIECILNLHQLILESAVLVFDHHQREKHLVAFVALSTKNTNYYSFTKTMRMHLLKHLPYYSVPTEFIILETLPRSKNGKIDRAALNQKKFPPTKTVGVQTPIEDSIENLPHDLERGLQLKSLWEEVLKVKDITFGDNFYDLGGDSFSCLSISAKARQLGIQLSVKDIFEHQNLENILDFLSRKNQDHTKYDC